MWRLLYPALTAMALHAALLGVYVVAFGGDISALTCTGVHNAGRFPYEQIAVQPSFGEAGYDGQFYYAIARAPFAHHHEGIDTAVKRQQRLFYPLVCWVVTSGDPVRLLWAMPLVNLCAIGGLAWLGGLVALRQECSVWWGVLLPYAVNAGLAALRDLTDVVSTFALAALLVGWLLRWRWWSFLIVGVAALFSREQNFAGVAIVFVCAAWRRQWLTCAGLFAAFALWVGWIEWLKETYRESPFLSSAGHIDWPLYGWYYAATHGGLDLHYSLRTGLCLALLAFQSILAIDLLRRREVEPALRLAALAWLGMALVGGKYIYEDVWSFSRVYAGLPLAVWLGCVQGRRLWPLPVMSAYALVQWGTVLKEWWR